MAIVVVSDASPIRVLNHLGLLWLCPRLYGAVIIPQAVQRELAGTTATCPAIHREGLEGFEVRSARNLAAAPKGISELGPGEAEATALAVELEANLLLVDERDATAVAWRLGIATLGVLGVLLEEKRRRLIGAVIPCVDRLVSELRFFVSDSVRERIGQLADETEWPGARDD